VTHRENIARGVSRSAYACRTDHCKNGHPFDEANTRYYRGRRNCRTCHMLEQRLVRATRK
jgi:hypothetical protein